MTSQKIIWTVLPFGRETEGPNKGRWRVSICVSPRLTPRTKKEQRLAGFAEWLDWPATVMAQKFALDFGGGKKVGLIPIHTTGASPQTAPDSALWQRLFHEDLAVSGFDFMDMTAVNLRSYPVRNVLGFVRRHYRNLSVGAAKEHPKLLPWSDADPVLKGMLGDAGTRVGPRHGNRMLLELAPGFGRFHERDEARRPFDHAIDRNVFGKTSCIKAPVKLAGVDAATTTFALRALPPDWEDPAALRSGAIAVSDPADREPRAQVMDKFSSAAEYALWQSDRFYRRSVPTDTERAMRRPDFQDVPPPPELPEHDFHRRVASYGDHPNLLRRLGLVIDCVLEKNDVIDAAIAAAMPAQGFMRLVLGDNPPHDPSGDTFPRTAWLATKRRFVVQSRTEDHAGGLLRLENANDRHEPQDHTDKKTPFDVYQVDPDGASMKTVNHLLTMQGLIGKHLVTGADGDVTYSANDKHPVAALRSGGLGISRHGRAGQVAIVAKAADLNNKSIEDGGAAAAQVTLYAEDVLRGYRVDVLDTDVGRWRSLCQREPRYTALPRVAGDAPIDIALPADEGCVKSASTTSQPDKPDDHYLHETLFRWTGWSLAAPRPGRAIRERTVPGTHLQSEDVVDTDDDAPVAPDNNGNGIAMKVTAAKGTSPRLRFGHSYRLRARIVDLAGNSLALDERDVADDEQATEPVTYGRFEPVDPPALVLPRKLSEGESLERLVLRSNFNRSTADYASDIERSLSLRPLYANDDFEYTRTADRHVVPPKSSQQQCELHGMFDAAIGSTDPAMAKKAYSIAGRESGSLMTGGEVVTPASVTSVATATTTIAPPDQADAGKDRFAAGQYLIRREPLVTVPYLADPACGGIALHDVPGISKLAEPHLPLVLLAPGLLGVVIDKGLRAALLNENGFGRWVLLVDFDADPGDAPLVDWPDDVQSLRLVLAEQPGEVAQPPCGPEHTAADAPQWDAGARTLTLFLPKGHIARLRYASFAHDRLIDHFGLPRWHDDADAAKKLRAEAMAGANWMMTPWRDLTLVHATQQPVCEPAMSAVFALRWPGDTHALLRAQSVRLHGPSTGKFEIVGAWEEWIDDPAQPEPKRVPHQAQLSEIRLADNHRNEFKLQEAVDEQGKFEPVGGQVTKGEADKRPTVPGNRHEFGDTRFRFVRYHLHATTRFREYLPPKVYDFADKDGGKPLITRNGPQVPGDLLAVCCLPSLTIDTDAGAPLLPTVSQGALATAGIDGLIVPASAPPVVPELIYTVPTFLWDRPAQSGMTVQSTRHGNGLRVYLDRPWFSSGDGELLGVVIAHGNHDGGHRNHPGFSPLVFGDDGGAFVDIDPALVPFVTQWGRDPLWDSRMPSATSRVHDFPAAVAIDSVALLEAPGAMVWVVGHRVHYEKSRQLWYCDIELDPGATYMPFVRLALVRYQPNAIEGAKISKVVLAEFAQVLPRRSAVLRREASAIAIALHGPVPNRGPMRQFNGEGGAESPYADMSPRPGFGSTGETGRNRVELVLQTRDPALDSDLAWTDSAVLGSGLVGTAPADGPGLGPIPINPIGPPVVPPEVLNPGGTVQPVNPLQDVPVRTRAGRTLRFDRTVPRDATPRIASALAAPTTMTTRGGPIGELAGLSPRWPLIDPPVWSLAATLPPLPTDRPARLMVREFERFYTDRTVPENTSGMVHRRVVVEERLVYAEVFSLT
jgi:hypothetical protein